MRGYPTIMASGRQGCGINLLFEILGKTLTRSGYWIHSGIQFNSVIKPIDDGFNMYGVMQISKERVLAPTDSIDILVAVDQEALDLHHEKLKKGGALFCDMSLKNLYDLKEGGVKIFQSEINKTDHSLRPKSAIKISLANTIYVGMVSEHIHCDAESKKISALYKEILGRKSPEILEANLKALEAGRNMYREALKQYEKDVSSPPIWIPSEAGERRMYIAGNEVMARAAIVAGCRVCIYYPITPASDLAENMAQEMKKYGGWVYQASDEMEAANMAKAISATGASVILPTSGPGLSRMVEAFGFTGLVETPGLVCVDVQRAGPATGMPTRTLQGDLPFVLSMGHDAYPRVIVAPGDLEECFNLTIQAFNLSRIWQLPVFILSDLYLAQTKQTNPAFDFSKIKLSGVARWESEPNENAIEVIPRYLNNGTGIKPIVFPGEGRATYKVAGTEHDIYGVPSVDPENRRMMMEGRMKKLEFIKHAMPPPEFFGSEDAEVMLITWGSPKGVVRQKAKDLIEKGKSVSHLHLSALWPLHPNTKKFLKKAKKAITIEQNYGGDLAKLLRMEYCIPVSACTDYSGLFLSGEMLDEILKEENL